MRRGPGYYRSRRSKTWPVLLLILAVLLVRYWRRSQFEPTHTLQVPQIQEGEYDVVRVVDGDTLIIRAPDSQEVGRRIGKEMRVRLLGIDCPETVKPNHPVETWGPEASKFSQDFVASGRVSLRLDDRRVDRYGRYLAYVYVDRQMLNEELVRQGLARVSIYPGDSESMGRKLRSAEDEAKQLRRGIWSDGSPKDSPAATP